MEKTTKLLGFNIISIEAERKENLEGELKISHSIKIETIKKYKQEDIRQESLKIGFDFEINYEKLGKVKISGNLFLLLNQKLLKEILTMWESKKIDQKIQTLILNIIIQKATVKLLQIENDIGLPPHIKVPVLKAKEKDKKE